MELILTLDVGTTSVKACLFDRQLRQTALTSREYALQTRGVCAEVEAQVYLDAAALWGRFCRRWRKRWDCLPLPAS